MPTLELAHVAAQVLLRPGTGAVAVTGVLLELQRAQPRRPLANSRLGPAEPIGQVDQAPAAMLPVERRGQAYGRVGALGPTDCP